MHLRDSRRFCLLLLAAFLLAAAGGCKGRYETRSLFREKLRPPRLAPEVKAEYQRNMEAAKADFDADPYDEMNIIWYGRRLAYLGYYQRAVAVYSRGIAMHPGSYRLLRHRGHRYITLRKFDKAIDDLNRAARLAEDAPVAVEPDGLPNARNQPTGTTHSSIYYHLGLAHYLAGNTEHALLAYRECMRYSKNPDMLCATSHWLYMTLRRLGHDAEAGALLEPITADMDIIENEGYHQLLLMYKGELEPADLLEGGDGDGVASATVAYGVGNWYTITGYGASGGRIFENIVAGEAWAAFGHIAAEADLKRLESRSR